MHADIIISVAGIPLLGLTLKAALAGMETMLDYGMMEAWDKSIREWYSREKADAEKGFLKSDEHVFSREFGSILFHGGIAEAWKPGFIYVTDSRLFLRSGGDIALEIPLYRIGALAIIKERFFDIERDVLLLEEEDVTYHLHVKDVKGFKEILGEASDNVRKQLLSVSH